MYRFTLFLSLVFIAIPFAAGASDYTTFTKDLVSPYSYYKKSLSLTSKKEDAEKAKAAIAAFTREWENLSAKYAKDVPEPFAKEKEFTALIARPVTVGREAAALMAKGEVKAAHGLLEEVRYLMWSLRVRNGIVALADKANSFHEAMEIVLDKGDEAKGAEALKSVDERFGPWLAVSWEEVALAPVAANQAAAIADVMVEGRSAIAALRTALGSGDRQAIKSSGTAVKNAYKKIFFMD